MSFLLRNSIIAVVANQELLHIESNNTIDSCMRFISWSSRRA